MIQALGRSLSRFSARWVPDPFVIALGLTLATFGLAWALGSRGPLDLLGSWGGRLDGEKVVGAEGGLWRLLAFTMQMCLILVTGFALADSGPVRRAIGALARMPRTPGGAVALTAVAAMVSGLVNWGLGLVVGALLAREVGRSAAARQVPVHYPLLGAAGYAGMMVWHGGLSGTAPLKVTQAKDIAELLPGMAVDPIPLSATLLSPLNLTVCGLLLVAVPWILVRLQPPVAERVPFAGHGDDAAPLEPGRGGPAGWLEDSPWLGRLFGAAMLVYLVRYLGRLGWAQADVNAVNLLFLALGLLLHPSPRSYAHAIGRAAAGCAGIVLQFPFYGGIIALMAASGLVGLFADAFVRVADPTTHGPLMFLASGFVNLFVPSGGGQWGVQGQVVLESARALGVDPGKAVMAFAYGDGYTNMLQPFWALPLLAITGLQARQIIGYSAAMMLLVGPIYLVALAVF